MSDFLRDHLQSSLQDAYTLERELGGGGMARVFLAEETRFRRRVVIKLLSPDLASGLSTERFEREISLAAQLQEPHIVPVFAAGDVDGLPWYAMPYVAGESLRVRIERGPVAALEGVSILRDVALALAYAHGHRVVHRDIKPENVLLHEGTAVVTDFGIAKALSASKTELPGGTLTHVGTSLGTPAYMAPEQAAADPATDHRADIYSWGVMAYELLAGRHPFADKATPQQLMAAHFAETPAPLSETASGASPAIHDLVMRCLMKDPADRPASASALISALDQTVARHAPPSGIRPASSAARVAMISAVIAAAVFGIWVVANRPRADRPASPASATVSPPEKSVAVLPFESVGGDTANVYFAEGIADELTTALARVHGLRVAATSSAFTYRNKAADPRDVGKALNVSAVLQGRVRRAGNRLRVYAQLTNAVDGMLMWTNSYEREAKDVFAVQDELTRDIVGALRVALANGTGAASLNVRTGTNDVQAYDLYLRGLHFLQQRGGGVMRSIPYFKQALARDSSFARAWAQLGTAYALLPYYSLGRADSANQQARAAAAIALRLDPSSAEAHAAMGMSHLLENAWDLALGDFERAIGLDPDYSLPYRVSMPALYMTGRAADAIARGRLAATMDPLAPTTFAVYSVALLNGNRREEALSAARRGVELDSLNNLARAALAVAEYLAGHADLAAASQRRVVREPHTSLWIGFVLAATGDREGAAALLGELERERGRNVHAESAIAWTYLGAGDTTRALDALERAAKAREPMGFVGPFGHPAYDSVRRSARFAAIIRSFGLDPRSYIAR